jgi:hypothetical protein
VKATRTEGAASKVKQSASTGKGTPPPEALERSSRISIRLRDFRPTLRPLEVIEVTFRFSKIAAKYLMGGIRYEKENLDLKSCTAERL